MGADDRIPGWGQPNGSEPDRRSVEPTEPGIPDRLSDVWHECRTRARLIFGLTALIQGSLGLIVAPLTVAQLERTWDAVAPASSDSADLNHKLQTALAVHDPLVAVGTIVTASLGFLSVVLLVAALAVLLLSPRDEDHTILGALRAVARYSMEFALAAAVVLFGATAYLWLEAALLGSGGAAPASAALQPGDVGGSLSQVFAFEFVVGVLAVILVSAIVRWAVAVPAMVIERIGVRAALQRSSELTRGRRLSIALTLIVIGMIEGIPFAVVLYGPLILLAPGPGLDARFITATLLTYVAWLVVAPFAPLALVVMYRDLRSAGPRPAR